ASDQTEALGVLSPLDPARCSHHESPFCAAFGDSKTVIFASIRQITDTQPTAPGALLFRTSLRAIMAARLQLFGIDDALPGMQSVVRSKRNCLRELRTPAADAGTASPRR